MRYLDNNPNHLFPHAELAAIHTELDRDDEARAEVAAILERAPEHSLERIGKGRRFYKNPEDWTRVLNVLRKAGLSG